MLCNYENVFICGSCDDAVSSSDIPRRMTWWVNNELVRTWRKLSWPHLRNYPCNCLQGLRNHNTLARTFGLRAEIWTRDIQNMKQEWYPLDNDGVQQNVQNINEPNWATNSRSDDSLPTKINKTGSSRRRPQTFSNKTTIYQPTIIKCCRYILQSLWNCIPGCSGQ
jgi:hypothetical protein